MCNAHIGCVGKSFFRQLWSRYCSSGKGHLDFDSILSKLRTTSIEIVPILLFELGRHVVNKTFGPTTISSSPSVVMRHSVQSLAGSVIWLI